MQGCELSHHNDHPPATSSGALAIQQRRVVALKEVSSLSASMQALALYAIDQGHVTIDSMETMADLLGLMRRQLEALRLDLSSH